MSLSVDGFWKAGFWSETFWADGFWFEGAPAAVITERPSGGFGNYRLPERDEDEVRRQRIRLGILPPELPVEDVEALKRAELLSISKAKRQLRQDVRDAQRVAELEGLLERLVEAQRDAEIASYLAMIEAMEAGKAELILYQRNRNAKAVLTMLGML